MQLQRILLPFINAVAITILLFALMQSLIGKEEAPISFPEPFKDVSFTPSRIDDPVIVTTPKPKKPKLLDETPKRIKPVMDLDPIDEGEQWQEPVFDPPEINPTGPSDGQLALVMGFPPVYPAGPASRGIEGYVVVGFSVSPSGAVVDAHVIESSPSGVFDKASLKAIKRFKYQPKMVNGRGVLTTNQRYMFTFRLDNNS